MTLLTLALPTEATRPRPANEQDAPTLEGGLAWHAVCALEDVVPDTGVCALVDGQQIAVVRVGQGQDTQVYALANFDPFSKAFVLSRGIVGDKAGVPKIASPIFKQNFDLRTGRCLDDPDNPKVAVPTFPARVRDGHIEIALKQAA